MSVENKIKELLNRTNDKQQLTEESKENLAAAGMADTGAMAAMKMSKDTSKAATAANAGDKTQPKQGSSKDASFTETDEDAENLGSKNAMSVSKDTTLPKSKGDAKSVKTTAMEEEDLEGDVITEDEHVDIQSQLNSIFGEELSEEFKSKATSIFEAAVIARVNSEMDKVTAKLEEQADQNITDFKAGLVEKVDSYLNYVVEQWMEENTLAIESGLRTEIAEDFIYGLKSLFKEHYIEVPEEKYDVLDELQTKADNLEAELNEAIEQNVQASKELAQLKQTKIFEEQTKDLAATEVEKLKKLVEGVDFENENLYREKVVVIKENYFPKSAPKSPEKMLVEESGTNPAAFDNPVMTKYVQALARTVKTR
jgi:hypothetical protein